MPASRSTDDASVTIAVIRSGGIAGMRRAWRAEPAAADTAHWIALIDDCPWDEAIPQPRGADQFTWRILVRCETPESPVADERTTSLPDHGLEGPWLALVDEVRARGLAVSPDEVV